MFNLVVNHQNCSLENRPRILLRATKTENVHHFARQYGLHGFRGMGIALAAPTTLLRIRTQLGPSAFLQRPGELASWVGNLN